MRFSLILVAVTAVLVHSAPHPQLMAEAERALLKKVAQSGDDSSPPRDLIADQRKNAQEYVNPFDKYVNPFDVAENYADVDFEVSSSDNEDDLSNEAGWQYNTELSHLDLSRHSENYEDSDVFQDDNQLHSPLSQRRYAYEVYENLLSQGSLSTLSEESGESDSEIDGDEVENKDEVGSTQAAPALVVDENRNINQSVADLDQAEAADEEQDDGNMDIEKTLLPQEDVRRRIPGTQVRVPFTNKNSGFSSFTKLRREKDGIGAWRRVYNGVNGIFSGSVNREDKGEPASYVPQNGPGRRMVPHDSWDDEPETRRRVWGTQSVYVPFTNRDTGYSSLSKLRKESNGLTAWDRITGANKRRAAAKEQAELETRDQVYQPPDDNEFSQFYDDYKRHYVARGNDFPDSRDSFQHAPPVGLIEEPVDYRRRIPGTRVKVFGTDKRWGPGSWTKMRTRNEKQDPAPPAHGRKRAWLRSLVPARLRRQQQQEQKSYADETFDG